jgi:predicted HD phosphohydrolase
MPLFLKNFVLFFLCFAAHVHAGASSPAARCDYLLSILEAAVDEEYIGEPVSQQQHALQCAYLAFTSGADEETILAALFHDIGHLCPNEEAGNMGVYGTMGHEVVGANFLHFHGLSQTVCELVLGHVQAKRYLTGVNPDYYENLSEASKQTLLWQGGPMSPIEIKAFEADLLFSRKIQMRLWDEQAKVVGWKVPDLNFYHPILLDHLMRQE